MVTYILVNIGSDNDMLPDDITWADVDFTLILLCDIHLRAIP